ncbi:MAG TPA: PilZ domain-containing protein [Sphingomonadaceae bacterium]|nr:PilZ domain-containing protein [Sphingomonadaceae bacterium]
MSQDRRTAERVPIVLNAVCRREGESWKALISNVSEGGCCLELPWKVLDRGDRIALELDEHLVLPATVAWAGTKRAGLAFSSPLFGAMITEYARQARKAAA